MTSNADAQSEPGYQRSAAPWQWHQPLSAPEGSGGSDKRLERPNRILVVEDDFLVAAQVETALSDAGFDVTGVADSADDAIELARTQKPDLIVMDVRLARGSDGIYAAAQIFRTFGIRCLFATAHYDQDSLERASPAKPLGWLQKPYSMTSLINAVRRALGDLDRDR